MRQALRSSVWNVARNHSAICLGVLLLFVVEGCTHPSSEDNLQLSTLKAQFGGRYEFSLQAEFYLRVRMKPGIAGSESEAQEIYRAFFMKKGQGILERRRTSYVYLNVYDSEGEFLWQLFYNPSSGKIEKSMSENY